MTVLMDRLGSRAHRAGGAVAGASLALLATACVVGPEYSRPPTPAAQGALPAGADVFSAGAGQTVQAVRPDLPVAQTWWTSFGSSALNALIQRAFERNTDVKAARAALRQAQETYLAARAAYAPQVTVGLSATSQKNPDVLASPLASNANLYNLYGASVDVSYVVDAFGAIRRQVQTNAALTEAQRYQMQATYLSLAANLAVAAVQAASVRDQVRETQAVISDQAALLAVLRRQLSRGQAAALDVIAQEQIVAQARAALPPLRKQLDQLHDQIRALSAGDPGGAGDEIAMNALTLPADLPQALASRVVEQRPDIRAAEANLKAANYQIGVAEAARFPNITLTGLAGGEGAHIGQVFNPGDQAFSIGAGLTQPIFEGGMLRHRERAARAAFDQAQAQYQSTVTTGLQNVSDVLHALSTDAEAVRFAAENEGAARRGLEVADRRFALGEAASTPVISARVALDQAALALSQASVQRYLDTIALYQALGGGWSGARDPARS